MIWLALIFIIFFMLVWGFIGSSIYTEQSEYERMMLTPQQQTSFEIACGPFVWLAVAFPPINNNPDSK